MIVFCLEKVMEDKGITAKQLLSAGMNRVTLKGLLSGRNTRIDYGVLDQLCRNLNCQPGDLFTHKP
jgi:putative transcriptional regulator